MSSSKVKRSQQLLERLGYFEEANITTEPTDDKDKVDLNVNVREGSTGSFSAGAGYSSSDGALFNARVTENNIFGTGRSVSINADMGTQRDNLVLSYTDNRINDSHISLGADLMRSERDFTDFDRRLTGGSLELGYPLDQVFGESFEDVSASLKYEAMAVDIGNVDPNEAAQLVINSQGASTSSSLSPRLTRNTINNPLNPTKGSKTVVSFEWGGLGGDQEYYVFELRNQWYQPIFDLGFGDFVFSWRTTLGYGDSMSDEPYPLFKRYFPGGINTVRGFKNRKLGPQDDNGHRYGGAKELVNNWEVIFPIANSAGIKGVLFFDAGEAFDDHQSIRIDDLRRSWGYGLRWTSPLGPIRIEFGYPLDRRDGEGSMVTLFSFGAPL
jgi:outer membrane protein insertion porin family